GTLRHPYPPPPPTSAASDTAKDPVMTPAIGRADQRRAQDRIGVGGNVDDRWVGRVERCQAAVIIFARVQARTRKGQRVVAPLGAIPAGITVADVFPALPRGQPGGVHLNG